MSILFKNVSKTYGSGFFKKEVRAVKDLDLSIEQGCIFGIIGANGAGKSTILKMLMDFIRPTKGEISILGTSPRDPNLRFKTGFLPENPYYYDHLTVEELLRFGASTCGISSGEAKKNIKRLLGQMELDHVKNRRLRTYSKGMVQRAGICFALVHDPELVIFDEPMSGLDPVGRKMVVDLILELKSRGKTVLFCSHILNDVERLCDRMAIMAGGRLKRMMTREELVKFQKQLVLSIPELPRALDEKLHQFNATIKRSLKTSRVFVPRENITRILKLLATHSIHGFQIDIESNALETIFFNTINGETTS